MKNQSLTQTVWKDVVFHSEGEYPTVVSGRVDSVGRITNLYVAVEVKGADVDITTLLSPRQREHFEARLTEKAEEFPLKFAQEGL